MSSRAGTRSVTFVHLPARQETGPPGIIVIAPGEDRTPDLSCSAFAIPSPLREDYPEPKDKLTYHRLAQRARAIEEKV